MDHGNGKHVKGGVRIEQSPPNAKQIELATKCVAGCVPGLVQHAVPRPGKGLLSLSVCFQCGAWWRVDEAGEVRERKQYRLEAMNQGFSLLETQSAKPEGQ